MPICFICAPPPPEYVMHHSVTERVSLRHYIVSHYVKTWHELLWVANNPHTGEGGYKQKFSVNSRVFRTLNIK